MNSPVLAFADYTKDFLLETCLKGRIGSSPLSETGRWMVSPGGLRQPGTFHAQEELSFYETLVFSTEVGCNRALQRVSAIPALPGQNRQ